MADLLDLAYFIDSSGRTLSVPAEQAPTALTLGYIPATAEQVADFKRARAVHEKYGTPLQGALATLEGLGSGATLGISDIVERAAGVSPEALRARSAEWPVAQPVARGVGM